MMKKLSFEIQKSLLKGRVELLSGYLALKRPLSITDYDRIHAIDEDSDVLDLLMEDAALEVGSVLGSRLAGFSVEGESVRFDLTAEADESLLLPRLIGLLSMSLLMRWLMLAGEEEAAGRFSQLVEKERIGLEASVELLLPAASRPSVIARSRIVPPIG